ncbi:Clavaminate synthase-like protein [Xylariaceae sp. FL1651]|nr:Clavaminate synthase-like protein [Xylariaceae sp. FL1651]
MTDNIELLQMRRAPVTESELKYSESYVVDLNHDDGHEGTQRLVETIKRAATTGIFHIINHGIPMDLIELQKDVAYTYFATTSLDQKDKDTTKNDSGVFEGYKLRTPEEKEGGLTPTIEEYNYDFYATGKVSRPPVMEKYEAEMSTIYKYYHDVLIPQIMRLLSLTCDKEPDHFYKMHDSSRPNSEIGHYLRYHTNWIRDNDKKRASYAGHTDIGSVTFLYCNPVACLQVYTPQGWRYIEYIPGSFIVNIGDCLESLTGGKFPAALHRLVKFQPDQEDYERMALVYFVHPHDDIIREHFRLEQERRQSLRGTNMMSGQEVNRLIMALSADNEDPYAKIIDEEVFLRAKSGSLVPAPEQLTFDYDSRTIRRTADADDNFTGVLAGSTASDGASSQFSEEQWRLIQSLAQEIAKSKVQFSEADWMDAMKIVNGQALKQQTTGSSDVGVLSQPQLNVLTQALNQTKAY